jgi:hypothetical protein
MSQCLHATLAAFNSISYESQAYSAFNNVVQSPQRKNVISATNK